MRELRTLVDVVKIQADVKEERFAAHTLQLAIQSALDVCSHIVSDEKLGEPQTNQELFTLLERHGWLSAPLAVNLRNMAGFRNILVHGYQSRVENRFSPALPHQTVHAIFPHTAFRCSSRQGEWGHPIRWSDFHVS